MAERIFGGGTGLEVTSYWDGTHSQERLQFTTNTARGYTSLSVREVMELRDALDRWLSCPPDPDAP